MLRLIGVLNDPNSTLTAMTEAIARDPSLAARVLKLANSASFGAAQRIGSVYGAAQLLGTQRLQGFASVMAASSTSSHDSQALSELGLVRARVCEAASRQLGTEPQRGFTIGLLSVLDALMGLPMASIVAELGLPPEIADALLTPEKSLELQAAIAIERGDWKAFRELPLDSDALFKAYIQATEGSTLV